MDDVFARIGLALQHLLYQSSVNGPAKDEVQRLADELQRFEGAIGDIIDGRIQGRMDQIEGRVLGHVDDNFSRLAVVLESAEINFEPVPAPLPVYVTPAEEIPVAPTPPTVPAEDAVVEEPAAETPAEPIPEPETAEAPAGGADEDTVAVEEVTADEAPAEDVEDSPEGAPAEDAGVTDKIG